MTLLESMADLATSAAAVVEFMRRPRAWGVLMDLREKDMARGSMRAVRMSLRRNIYRGEKWTLAGFMLRILRLLIDAATLAWLLDCCYALLPCASSLLFRTM